MVVVRPGGRSNNANLVVTLTRRSSMLGVSTPRTTTSTAFQTETQLGGVHLLGTIYDRKLKVSSKMMTSMMIKIHRWRQCLKDLPASLTGRRSAGAQ